ncbi:hypothetical protein N7540_012902 [Penicillium herquei]|nr:hypothetical protein N7540_012902 [Penicillium herquei]
MQAPPGDRDRGSILTQDEPIDQTTGLPSTFHLDITKIHYFLHDPDDFRDWLRKMTQYLEKFGLDKLLDIRVPRPRRENPDSSRWLEFSRNVSKWLAQNISSSLLERILAHGKNLEPLADKFIAQAKTEFEHSGIYEDMPVAQKFLTMSPATYAKTSEFVRQFMKMMIHFWATEHLQIHPYFALCQMLNQLRMVENKDVLATIITDLDKKVIAFKLWTNLNIIDFQTICHNIAEHLEAPEAARKRKNWPPPGANHHEHAKMLRETLPQFTEDKTCAHCGDKFHIAANCWYLNPDTRPALWSRKDDVWMYEPDRLDAQTGQPLGGSTVDRPSIEEPSVGSLNLGSLTLGGPAVDEFSVGRLVVGDKKAVEQRQLSIKGKEKAPAAEEEPQDTPKIGSVGARIYGRRSSDPTRSAEALIKLSDNNAATAARWIIVDEDAPHVCIDRSAMTEYHEYGRDEGPVCEVLKRVYGLRPARALGWGKATIEVLLTDGTSDEMIIDCRYYNGLRHNFFFLGRAQKDLAITFDMKDSTLRDGEGNQVACVVKVNGLDYLRTSAYNEMVE